MLMKITMPPFSPKPTTSYNVRSISFPARSHPNIQRIEEQISKLNSWLESSSSSSSAKAERVGAGLTGLTEIYICMENLLNLPLTQQAVAQHQEEKWVADTLDDLVRFLDLCGSTRDCISSMKQSVRELESALRRSKAANGGELSIESNVNAYFSSRKKMKKEAAKNLESLKQKDMNLDNISLLLDSDDHYLSAIVKSIREANSVCISIFSSLMIFLSSPILKPRSSKWSLLSKLVQKCESQETAMNELENADNTLTNLLTTNSSNELEEEKVQSAQKMLEVLDISIEELENELEGLFRVLIHTRVSFLNIVSHQ